MKEETIKIEMKKVTPSGNAGHIPMNKKDIGKNFIILPESQKHIIRETINNLREITNPKLNKYLTQQEIQTIKETYKRKIENTKGFMTGIQKKQLENNLKNIDQFKLEDIAQILNDIQDELPQDLRKKLLKEYYKHGN